MVSRTDPEKLSFRSGSLNGHPRTNLFQNGDAQATRARSKTSRRRSSWCKPRLFACPVCGVIRGDFQHPNLGDGSSSGNHVESIFKWKVGLDSFLYCSAVLQAISGMAISMVTCGRLLSKRLCPHRTHQVEGLAEDPSLTPPRFLCLPPS